MLHTALRRELHSPSQLVLGHVERYRMTVLAALKRLPGLSHLGARRIVGLLRDLCRAGDLERGTLFHHQAYFHLPRRNECETTEQPELPDYRRGPLSETAKIRNYAILAFCCLGHVPRFRLTKPELLAHFPALNRPGLPLN